MWAKSVSLLWCPMCGAERPDSTHIGWMDTGGTLDLGISVADDSADYFIRNKVVIVAEERMKFDPPTGGWHVDRFPDPGTVDDPGLHLSWPSIRRAYRAVAVWVGTLRTGR